MTKGMQARDRLSEIHYLLKVGEIDRDTAEDMAKEPLRVLNEQMEKISKEFGKRHRKVTFTSFMRKPFR